MKELLDKWEEYTESKFGKGIISSPRNFTEFMQWYKEQEAHKPWVPVEGEMHWYIGFTNIGWTIYCLPWKDTDADKQKLESNNCFKTGREAEAALERVKAALKNL